MSIYIKAHNINIIYISADISTMTARFLEHSFLFSYEVTSNKYIISKVTEGTDLHSKPIIMAEM